MHLDQLERREFIALLGGAVAAARSDTTSVTATLKLSFEAVAEERSSIPVHPMVEGGIP
jgi:hypothetical protein